MLGVHIFDDEEFFQSMEYFLLCAIGDVTFDYSWNENSGRAVVRRWPWACRPSTAASLRTAFPVQGIVNGIYSIYIRCLLTEITSLQSLY